MGGLAAAKSARPPSQPSPRKRGEGFRGRCVVTNSTQPPTPLTTLMGQRRFAALFWVQSLGAFNDQVFKTGLLTLLTFRLADKLGLDASLHNTLGAALFILPFALFAPTAGQIADGVDKAKMMRFVKFTEIVLMVLAAIAYQIQNLAFLYVLLFLMGAQSAAFAPIKYGVLPQYMRENELISANGLIQGATFLAILLGQIAGAKLILTDAGVTIIGIVVIGVALIGFAASWFAPPAPPLGDPPRVDWLFPRAMWNVIISGRKVPKAFEAILGIAWFWFVGATFLTLLPPYAKEALHGGEDVFILLLATFSVGVAIGAVLCGKIFGSQARVRTAAWGAAGIALFSVLLWIATRIYVARATVGEDLAGIGVFLSEPTAWLVLICFAMMAACAGLYLTPVNVVLQVEAPPSERGRFIACSNTVDAVAMTLSAALAAALTALGMGQASIFALVGATGALAAFWAARHER